MAKAIGLGIIVLLALAGVCFESAAQAPLANLEEIIAQRKAELNGRAYNVELKPRGVDPKARVKPKPEADVISFAEGKVISKKLAGLGYAASGFSVRLEDDGTLIWETMQASEKGELAFWRGDIGPDGIMRGVLSMQDARGRMSDFDFVSVGN